MNWSAIGVQLIVAVMIVGLGFWIFKTYPLKKDTQQMVSVAVFIMVSKVFAMFLTINLPLFGFDTFKIGFAQIVLVIGGSLVSPSWAFIMGLVDDMLGLITEPTAFPFLGFTLNSILACVLPSLWYHRKHFKTTNRDIMILVDIFLVSLACLGVGYVFFNPSIKIDGEVVVFDLWMKCCWALLMIVVGGVLICTLHIIRKKTKEEYVEELTNWMMVVLMIEVVIQFCSTPFWLDIMYGVPWTASLFLRIVKACVMIPVNVFIGFFALRMLRKRRK